VNSWKFLHGSDHDMLSLYGHGGNWSQGLSGGNRRIELTCIKKKQNFPSNQRSDAGGSARYLHLPAYPLDIDKHKNIIKR